MRYRGLAENTAQLMTLCMVRRSLLQEGRAPENRERAARRSEPDLQIPGSASKLPSSEIDRINARCGGCCADLPYLFRCQRHIELNPVRANMVEHPAEYRWSSYRANAQGEKAPLLRPHPLYEALGRDVASRQAGYLELFRYELEPGLVDEIRGATNGNCAVGNERFAREVALALGRRAVPGKIRAATARRSRIEQFV